jgi:hypothetical protein
VRTPEEIQKEFDDVMRDWRAASSLVEMMRKGSPRDFIEEQYQKKVKPLDEKIAKLKAELKEVTAGNSI